MAPARATPKAAAGTPPEIVRAARAARRGLTWAAAGIALLLGDALSPERKARQKRRRDNSKNRDAKGSDLGEPGA